MRIPPEFFSLKMLVIKNYVALFGQGASAPFSSLVQDFYECLPCVLYLVFLLLFCPVFWRTFLLTLIASFSIYFFVLSDLIQIPQNKNKPIFCQNCCVRVIANYVFYIVHKLFQYHLIRSAECHFLCTFSRGI